MKKIIALFFATIFTTISFAQKSDLIKTVKHHKVYSSFEIGGGYGESHYYGDLSKGFIQLKNMHQDLCAFIRYQRGRNWAVKLMYNKGEISGNDAYNTAALKPRNLQFFSPLKEYALMAEYAYPEFTVCRQYNWSPYITAGIALFKFQPQANGFGDLRSLSTEGEGLAEYPDRKEYALTQISIPVGIGIKFIPAKRIIVGAELAMRKTFTDYLDDVSTTYVSPAILLQEKGEAAVKAAYRGSYKYPNNDPTGQTRGKSSNNDWYCIFTINVSIALYYDCFSEQHRYNDVGGCKSF